MSDLFGYLWLIPALPLAASILTTLLGPRLLRQHSHWPCILASVGSCVLSVLVLLAVRQNATVPPAQYYTWFKIGTVDVGFSLQADALTAVMLVTITFIGSLIAIYSVGYMHGDEGYPRFFAEVALFIFSMTGLVLAANFLLLYAFWEGVGLCSYLLIGFWFAKPAAAAAARKAFLVTRLGDIGLLLGILLLWAGFHQPSQPGTPLYALDFRTIFQSVEAQNQGTIFAACLLIFCGAVGKSAQFPLHIWLPDAMEGPTPVSALIHAATMVTAGVYLVARCTPLFQLAPEVQLIVASIGAITALGAAIIALTQNDLKRVLAYSTISQLGFMFMALGAATLPLSGGGEGGDGLVAFAVVAAMFHLFTHAFFKALLFLGAGSVMHSMGGVIDMRRFSGLRSVLKTTHWTFLCGALALAGFPLLAGFWSKDEILTAILKAAGDDHPYRTAYATIFAVAILTALLTAFYTFRAYFRTFWGELRIPHEAGEHAHESPPVMLVPLMILAVGALFAGFLNAGLLGLHGFGEFLEGAAILETTHVTPAAEKVNYLFLLASVLIAPVGITLAWWMYIRKPALPERLARTVPSLYQASLNKLYLDDLYGLLISLILGLATVCRVVDYYIVDGLVDLVGRIPRLFGYLFRPIQNGLTQFYALAMALGLTVFIVAMVWRLAM